MSVEAYGTDVSYGNESTHGASTTWTALAALIDIDAPEDEADVHVWGTFDAPGARKKKLAGLADAGQMELTLEFAPEVFTALRGLYRVQRGWKIDFPDGSAFLCDGILTKIGLAVTLGEVVQSTVTIDLTGATDFNEPA